MKNNNKDYCDVIYKIKMCPNCGGIYYANQRYDPLYHLPVKFCSECGYDLYIKEIIPHASPLSSISIYCRLENELYKHVDFLHSKSISQSTYHIHSLAKLLRMKTLSDFNKAFDKFIKKNSYKIKFIINERIDEKCNIQMLSNPDVILVFYLIETNVDELYSFYQTHSHNFDLEELRKLSLWWGKSVDDLDDYL